jgi:2,3-bisphosphoglycerate-dependent phosphoglycerate mutase
MTEIFLVRHGEPDWANSGQGYDPVLTEEGRGQAQLMGAWVKENLSIDSVFASTLKRAKETADIANKSLNLDLNLREELEEWPHPQGVWNVLDNPHSFTEFANPFVPILDIKHDDEYVKFGQRVHSAINEIASTNKNKSVLVVCHGGVIGQVFRNITGNHYMPLISDFTGMSRIYWEEERWVIGYMNRLDHLNQC